MQIAEVVDVTRYAKSVGIRGKCLMSRDALGLAQSELAHQEVVAAKAMGILFWLRRAWASEGRGYPPSVFEAKTCVHEVRRLEVQVVEDSILVGVCS